MPHVASVLLLALIAFVINRHTPGTVVAQGDFYQTTDFSLNKYNSLFTWFRHSGQGQFNPLISTFPFYAVQWLLSSLGAGTALIADFLVFQFLALSYVGMLLAQRVLRPLGLPGVTRLPVWALLYAMNPMTFLALSYSWGYLHHLLIYPFIPLLLAVTLRLVLRWERHVLLAFVPLATASTVGYNNLGFLNALVLLQVLLGVSLLITRAARLRSIVRGLLACFAVEAATSAHVWAPFLASQRGYASKVTGTKAFGGELSGLLRGTSPGFDGVLSLDFNAYHFPALLPLGHDGALTQLLVAVTILLPVGLLLLCLIRRDRPRPAPLALMLLALGVLLLAARVSPPVQSIGAVLYGSPFLLLLRSPDKVYVFLPGVLAFAGLAVGLPRWTSRRLRTGLASGVVLGLAMPFLLGLIPAYMNERFGSDLLTPDPKGYSSSVRVPPAYRELANYLNAQPGNAPVVSLPNASATSLNWSNYPSWGLVGHDFLLEMVRRPYVSANTHDHPTLETGLSFQDFNTRRGRPSELLKLVQRFGGQFVLFHKDVPPPTFDGAKPTANALAALVAKGDMVVRMSSEQFDLYELSPELVTPLVSSPVATVFQRVSPVQVEVQLDGLKGPTPLEFRQSHNGAWRLELLPWREMSCSPVAFSRAGGNPTSGASTGECAMTQALAPLDGLRAAWADEATPGTHVLVDNFANGWTISPDFVRDHFDKRYYHLQADGTMDLRLRIYFLPQSVYYWSGLAVLLLNAAALVMLFLRRRPEGDS